MKTSYEIVLIARKIGNYYFQKNKRDRKKTIDEINNLLIEKIELINDDVHITLGRPGLLIGCKGRNIEDLEKHICKKIKIFERKEHIVDHLLSFDDEEKIDYHPATDNATLKKIKKSCLKNKNNNFSIDDIENISIDDIDFKDNRLYITMIYGLIINDVLAIEKESKSKK